MKTSSQHWRCQRTMSLSTLACSKCHQEIVDAIEGDHIGSNKIVHSIVANFLHAVAKKQRLVLFFDDLQWADVSTIDLLNFLAGRFETLNVFIIVTYRAFLHAGQQEFILAD